MANTLRFKRGLASGLPTGLAGEPLFTTDTFDLYIGNGTGNTRFQKFIASGTTSQLLRGDGSLLTMPIVLTSPSNGQVLKYNGTSWVNDSDAGITGSGTTNYLPKFTGASTLGNSLVFDNGTSVGIGSTTPAERFSVYGGDALFTQFTGTGNGSYLKILNSTTTTNGTTIQSSYFGSGGFGDLKFEVGGSQRYRVTSGGNFIINNSSTDNGLRFQVTGDGYFSGAVGIGSASLTSYNLRVTKNITGSSTSTGIYVDGAVQNDVTSQARGIQISPTIASGTAVTDLIYYFARQNTFTGTATNQFGFFVDNNLTGATNNYAYWGNIASGTGRWNLYMNGTAANYLAGTLAIGNTNAYHSLQINSSANFGAVLKITDATSQATGAIALGDGFSSSLNVGIWRGANNSYSSAGNALNLQGIAGISFMTGSGAFGSNTERMRLDASGNLGLGVTPSGSVRLEVNGAARLGTGTATVGATTLEQTYSGDNVLGVISAYQGTGAMILGYGIKAKTSADAFISTFDNFTGRRAAFSINQGYFEFFNTSAVNTAKGTDVAATSLMRLHTTGNLVLGGTTSTDAGFRLDVNGTMRVSGASTLSGGVILGHTGGVAVTFPGGQAFRSNGGIFIDYGNGGTGDLVFRRGAGVTNTLTLAVADGAATFSSSVTLSGNLTVDTNTLFVDAATNRVGIGIASPLDTLHVNGGDLFFGNESNVIQNIRFRRNGATVGSIGTYGNQIEINGGSTLGAGHLAITSTGNVGISNTSPSYKLDVTGSVNSIQARFGNVAGRGLTIGTSAISGTNDAGVVFNAPTATDGTLVFQTSSTDRMTLNSSGLNVATAIAIGTTPDTNLPFKILKNINSTVGIRFENTSTGASAYSAVQFGTDVTGGTAFTNMVYGSSGITESGVYKPNGTSIINTGSGGLNFLAVSQPIRFFTSTGNGTLRAEIANDGFINHYTGTAPSTNLTDGYRQYSADITAGNAAPHFRTENGGIIKLYQQTTGVTSATYIGGAGTGLTDSDTFDGYTIAQIVKALRNAGLLA